MENNTAEKLKALAERYEVPAFCDEDPSQFIRWYSDAKDVELCCFVAAMLSFGNRKQFIPKIRQIMELADEDGGIAAWLLEGSYKNFGSEDGNNQKKFYRFYSYDDMLTFFEVLSNIAKEGGLGCVLQKRFGGGENFLEIISDLFKDCAIVPKGKNSANKRVHMFLRWMVRRNSPVDLGLWDWYDPADLIIPLDTHVVQESIKLGLIPENAPASLKTAVAITEQLKQIWPEDPCKGDFALFGLGVDK